ncbi:MAG: hypothetical protein V1781_09400 [Bacteroidota bacterium]
MIYSDKKRFDSIVLGMFLGLLSPFLSLFIFYFLCYNHLSFSLFFTEIILNNNILCPVISLCTISNLLVFFIFIWSNRNYNARGVLLSTLIYMGYVVYQKYFLE